MQGIYEKSKGIIWLTIWFFLNVGLTLLNKSLLDVSGFKFPVMLSFIHQSISTILSFFESVLLKKQNHKENLADRYEIVVTKKILILSLIFTTNIVFGNMSLKYCSVAFVQICRAIIPLITMVFSIMFLGAKYTMNHFLSCIVICVGVALSCFGELNLTLKGFIITVVGCFLSSMKSISVKKTLTGDYTVESSDLLARMSPISAIEMFFLSLSYGEHQKIVTSQKYVVATSCIVGAIISGIIAYFLNLANFKATHYTSPLTVTIIGCVKQIVTIVISVILFEKSITLLNTIGIIVTTAGSLWYSLLGLKKNPVEKKPIEKQIENPLHAEENEFKEVPLESTDDVSPKETA